MLALAASLYAVITIAIRLRDDYDPTTTYGTRLLPIRRKQKMNMSIFRRSRIVVDCDNALVLTQSKQSNKVPFLHEYLTADASNDETS